MKLLEYDISVFTKVIKRERNVNEIYWKYDGKQYIALDKNDTIVAQYDPKVGRLEHVFSYDK